MRDCSLSVCPSKVFVHPQNKEGAPSRWVSSTSYLLPQLPSLLLSGQAAERAPVPLASFFPEQSGKHLASPSNRGGCSPAVKAAECSFFLGFSCWDVWRWQTAGRLRVIKLIRFLSSSPFNTHGVVLGIGRLWICSKFEAVVRANSVSVNHTVCLLTRKC